MFDPWWPTSGIASASPSPNPASATLPTPGSSPTPYPGGVVIHKYTLFGVNGNGATGPAAGTAFSGNYQAGMSFEVTASPYYLDGYWWWCCNTGQATTAVGAALWCVAPNAAGGQSPGFVTGSATTSATLTAGSWNFIPLATSLALTPGVPYRATVGMVNNFPDTNNQFGALQPYAAGITNGPLFAYSDSGGSAPQPYGDKNQSTFALANSPTTTFPGSASNSFNSWLDVEITNKQPTGPTYRAWPNYPKGGLSSTDVTGYTLGMEFSLTRSASLQRIWHWSPSGSVVLPTRCLIWDVGTQTAVSGTDNASPTWSGVAGSGWVSCDYTASGVTLAASHNYKVSTFHGPGAGQFWFGVTTNYWTTGDGGAGKNFGILTVPNNAGATPGQSSWNAGSFGYPNTSSSPENDWLDVEVM